ncbi:MAG: fasciclin domain-containing protein [Cyanobacteria bacterium P01_A01_bin.40]
MADILDTLINDGSFNTLVTAVKAADLTDHLKSRGSFTVLAPNDLAFSKLHEGMLDELAKDIPLLKRILDYHIFYSKVMATNIAMKKSFETNEDLDVNIDINNRIEFNHVTVLKSDVQADNGIIHTIDTVLMPW